MGQEPASEPQAGQEPAPATEPKDDKGAKDEPKTFDADYVSKLRAEAADWRIKAQQAQERAEEFEERDKSELEKVQAKLSKAEQAKADAEARLLRYEVATAKQIPADAMDLLVGSTREELEAKADRLLELVKNRTETESTPDFDGGAREPAPEPKSPEDAHTDTILALMGLAQPKTP